MNEKADDAEIGSGLVVAGVLLLLFDGALLAFFPMSLRTGGHFLQVITLAVTAAALILIAVGARRRNKAKENSGA